MTSAGLGAGVRAAQRLGLFGLRFAGFMDHLKPPKRVRLKLARKIDAILKRSVVASVLGASSPVGYYYLVHLPRQDAQLEAERVLERLRTAAQKRAEQELSIFEQKVLEQRETEQKAAEERQALEKANRYEACLSRTTDRYNAPNCDVVRIE